MLAALLLHTASLRGQNSSPSAQPPAPTAPSTVSDTKSASTTAQKQGPLEILSDTKGVDVRPYVGQIIPKVRTQWYKFIPASAQAPSLKRGKVSIEFHVMKDGTITDAAIVNSSGDIYMDRAARGGIVTLNPLPALPHDFNCKYLVLRFNFYYNPGPNDLPKDQKPAPLIPCVTTAIHVGGEIGIKIFPESARIIAGSNQQFSTLVSGDGDPAVKWSLTGPGCASSDCGTISETGLYRAPRVVLKPLTVTVTTTLTAAPKETASANVTIIESPTLRKR